jgi:hypothetical protein
MEKPILVWSALMFSGPYTILDDVGLTILLCNTANKFGCQIPMQFQLVNFKNCQILPINMAVKFLYQTYVNTYYSSDPTFAWASRCKPDGAAYPTVDSYPNVRIIFLAWRFLGNSM